MYKYRCRGRAGGGMSVRPRRRHWHCQKHRSPMINAADDGSLPAPIHYYSTIPCTNFVTGQLIEPPPPPPPPTRTDRRSFNIRSISLNRDDNEDRSNQTSEKLLQFASDRLEPDNQSKSNLNRPAQYRPPLLPDIFIFFFIYKNNQYGLIWRISRYVNISFYLFIEREREREGITIDSEIGRKEGGGEGEEERGSAALYSGSFFYIQSSGWLNHFLFVIWQVQRFSQ